MERSEGFAPVERADARVLILGSLPGQKSIAVQRYYGHPRNAFWPIMREVFGIDGHYEVRCLGLIENQIALWDVLKASVRAGSLDSKIRLDTAQVNDFHQFFDEHPDIQTVLFNGRKAEQIFRRTVPGAIYSGLELYGLPSTSPAFAALPFEGKLCAWKEHLTHHNDSGS